LSVINFFIYLLFVDFLYQNYDNSAANKEQKLLNLVFCLAQLKIFVKFW